MKLSTNSIEILKSFSVINPGIILKKGRVQRTLCSEKVILAEVELEESFPVNFPVHDLNIFLANISLMNNPELTFTENNVIMRSENDDWELDYEASSASVIHAPPDKDLVMDKVDVRLNMTSDTIQKIARISQINTWGHLTISGKKGVLKIITNDNANAGGGHASRPLSKYEGDDFSATFKVSNLKVIPDDYDVEIMLNGFAKFVSKNKPIKYFISLEAAKD